MTTREHEPSNLPPNPSIGELVTEIDRARHEVAMTLTALADKTDVRARLERSANERIAGLRQRRDELVPVPVARALGTVTGYAKQVPVPVRLAAVVVLLTLWRVRRHRR